MWTECPPSLLKGRAEGRLGSGPQWARWYPSFLPCNGKGRLFWRCAASWLGTLAAGLKGNYWGLGLHVIWSSVSTTAIISAISRITTSFQIYKFFTWDFSWENLKSLNSCKSKSSSILTFSGILRLRPPEVFSKSFQAKRVVLSAVGGPEGTCGNEDLDRI